MKIYHLSCIKVLLHEMPLGVNRASSHLALSLVYDIRHKGPQVRSVLDMSQKKEAIVSK